MSNPYLGSWTLLRFDIITKEGITKPWGQGARGLLIYADSDHMSVSINKDLVSKSDNHAKDVFDSVLFYAGTYAIEGNVIKLTFPPKT